MVFCDWLFSPSMFSKFIHAITHISTSFLYIAIYVYTMFCLFISWYLSRSHFWLFGVMLLWTSMYRFLWGRMFSFFLEVYLRVGLLSHMVTLDLTFGGAIIFLKRLHYWHIPRSKITGSYDSYMFNILRNYQTFPKWLYHISIPPTMYEDFKFPTSFQHLCDFLISTILVVCEIVSNCVFWFAFL